LGFFTWIVLWGMLIAFASSSGSSSSDTRTVVIPEAVSVEELVSTLHGQGLVQRKKWLEIYLRHFREPKRLKPGEYALNGLMTPAEMLDQFVTGSVVTYTVTIAAGAKKADVVAALSRNKIVDARALEAALADEGHATKLGFIMGYEGYLFPDAYNFPRGLDAYEVLKMLVTRHREAVSDDILADAKKVGLDRHQLVTLASLIEVDGVPSSERSMVSSVYHNRLAKGMKLQHPATVAYGMDKSASDLTQDDLQTDHMWNTYVHEGLPPTPIASPSLSAIVAAARPAKSDALYFAPRGDSQHMFCPDEECHRIALERWRKENARKKRVLQR
jgi:UPF0755 protein